MPGKESQIHDWSIVVLHEGYTSTLKILEGGFKHLFETYGIKYRVIKFTEDSNLSIGATEIPLLIRSASPWIASFATKLTEVKKPFIYFIDDDFWSISLKTDLGKFYRNPSTLLAMRSIISQATLVITNTEILASRIRKFTRKIQVFPAYFDFSLVDKYANLCRKAPNESSKIRIGFASNVSRIDDLKMIEGPLLSALSKYPNLEVDVIGLMPVALSGHASVNVFPYMNSYEEYIAFQMGRQWDIGLAPLLPSKQAASKTNNKFREYSAMGIAGIYSDEAPYKEVRDFENGMLAKPSPKAWERALFTLIENSDLRTQVSLKANSEVREKYDISHIMKLWVEAIEPVAATNPQIGIDWSRGEVRHKVPKLDYALFTLRTRGPVVVWRHYSRRVWEIVKSRFNKFEIDPAYTFGALIEGSEWYPPRNRFTANQPSISVIAVFDQFTSIDYCFELLESLSQQSFSDFEVIIVANNITSSAKETLHASWETNANIGLSINLGRELNKAILLNQGYLFSRSQSIVIIDEGIIPDTHAFGELNHRTLSIDEGHPQIIISSKLQVLSENQPNLKEVWFSLSTGDNPFSNRVVCIPRAVLEQVGLFDPHILASGLSGYDFWKRTSELFDYVEVPGLLNGQSTIPGSHEHRQKVEYYFHQLIWLEQERSQQLLPRNINKYSTAYVDSSLGTYLISLSHTLSGDELTSGLELETNKVAVAKTPAIMRIAVISNEINSQIQRVFKLEHNWDGIQFIQIVASPGQEISPSIVQGANAIIWVDDLARSNLASKYSHGLNIPQYSFLTSPSSVTEQKNFLAQEAPEALHKQTILVTSALFDLARSQLVGFNDIAALPDEYLMPKHSLFIRAPQPKGSELRVGYLGAQGSFMRHYNEIIGSLSAIAIKNRQKISLVTLTNFQLAQESKSLNEYFRVQHLRYSDDFKVVIRRLREANLDLIVTPAKSDLEALENPIFFDPSLTGSLVGALPIYIDDKNSRNQLKVILNNEHVATDGMNFDWPRIIKKISVDPSWIAKLLSEQNAFYFGSKQEKQNRKVWGKFLRTYLQAK